MDARVDLVGRQRGVRVHRAGDADAAVRAPRYAARALVEQRVGRGRERIGFEDVGDVVVDEQDGPEVAGRIRADEDAPESDTGSTVRYLDGDAGGQRGGVRDVARLQELAAREGEH